MKFLDLTGLQHFYDKYLRPLKDAAFKNTANNLTTETEGSVLDARQGKVLNDLKLSIAKVINNLLTTEEGFALDARQGKVLDDKITKLNGNNYELGEGNDTYEGERIWYKKYNNGLIEYWGRCSSPAQGVGGQGYGTVNFPIPFTSVYNYTMNANSEYAGAGTPLFLTGIQRISNSRAYIYTYNPYGGGIVTGAWICWEAKGYWK